jgi:hypothetical protein
MIQRGEFMKHLLTALIFSGSGFLGITAYAQGGSVQPCKQIKAACETAGFKKGKQMPGSRGPIKNCMDPILSGQTVAGVTVGADVVAACNGKKAARHHKRK